MALSNRTLSGCFDPTLASGFTDFLLVQAMVITSSMPTTAINGMRRDICTSKKIMWGRPSSAVRRAKLDSSGDYSAADLAAVNRRGLPGALGSGQAPTWSHKNEN